MGNNKWKEFEVNSWLEPNEAYLMINDCEKERDKLILRTMWETAGRVTEVLSLIPKHIDVINNSIDLPNLKQLGIKKKYSETDEEYSIRKAEHKRVLDNRYSLICQTKGPLLDTKSAPLKTIYLFPESTLCNDLLEYAKKEKIEKEQWLFKGFSKSGRVSSSYIWRLLSDKTPNRKQGLAVEHQIIKKKTTDKTYAWPHLFRHGAAMYILKRIGRLDIVQQQLGHSTILTTEGYAKATNDDRREVIQNNILENKVENV